ncbi:MAG: hypothetical protein PVH00_01820 [Gemmatimonadota bacterium]|jgi:hypothetical protein
MRLASLLWMYGRFIRGLRPFLRDTVTAEGARAAVKRRLAEREATLIHVAERGFFGAPRSPYGELFRIAGCDFADFRRLVLDRGVEDALRDLRAAGVFFTFEEFKGRVPVVRAGREIAVRPSDFDNPWLSHYLQRTTSGTTGLGTRVSTDLDHLALEAEHRLLCLEAHGVLEAPYALWRPPLPAGSGINSVLRGARIGRPPVRWFTPLQAEAFRPPLRHRLANRAILLAGRALGAALPDPEPVPLDDAVRIAGWMAEARDAHGGALVNTTVSGGARVGLAAHAAGIDLTGTAFMVAGEPASPAKVRSIRSAGARHFTDYGMAEAGRLGSGCARAQDENDVHVMLDAYAVITWPREVPVAGERLESFHITHLHPAASKLLLNVEFDDYGTLEARACGCPLEALGLRTHLRGIQSFGKLTGEGVSLVGSEMVHILEEVLPARFGGSPLDYQMVEQEDDAGLTRLTLRVHPAVALSAEAAVLEAVHDALARESLAAGVARAFWRQAGTLRVERAEPHVGARGKQLPLYSALRHPKREETEE